MNILLVNPWVTDFAAYDLWMKPLGLLYAGAFLSRRDHNIRLVDCMDRLQDSKGREIAGISRQFGTGKFHREIIEKPGCLKHVPRNFYRYGIPLDLFRELVLEGIRPDVVLVTCSMTYWYHGAFEAISLVHELLPDVPVLLGGIYATLCTDHARKHSGADAVIAESLPSLIIDAVEHAGGDKGGGTVVDNHFSVWPAPLWELYSQLSSAVVMTSRGCPMNCTVCASRLLFDGFERRDPIEAAKSILQLAERGVTDVAFSDDALLLDTQRYAVPMFEELANSNAPVRLHSPNGLHVREMTPETALLMKRAGMVTVRLSLETSSAWRAVKDFSGKVSADEFNNAVDALFSAGYTSRDVGAYILVGLPGQSKEGVNDTVEFAAGCGVQVKPALFSPVPGTVEFERAVEAGMIRENDDPVLQNNTLRTIDFWDDNGDGYNEFRRIINAANSKNL
jgi:radical SAM superfamily enzyme YgiQ (UPF0313 family)